MEKTVEVFDKWNIKKIALDKDLIKHIVKKRQFWLFTVGVNIWNEESR